MIGKIARIPHKDFIINAITFLLLFSWVMSVNYSILGMNLIYPEQPYFYIINEKIHSLADLVHIYTHPQMLNIYCVPFFRPSGDFLIYQILMPFLGWHNTKGLIIVNFVFLALTGYLLLQIYQILFPRMKIGGYIAFSIYLMHPALMLSRFIAMHFEFAYVFFLTWSLYCFMLFCQRNTFLQNKLNNIDLFISSLVLYAVAVTFKEPAIMLGLVLILYLLTDKKILFNRAIIKVTTLILITSILLWLYLTLQWPNTQYAHHHRSVISATLLLLKNIIGWASPISQHPGYSWCEAKFPWQTQILLSTFIFLCLWTTILIFKKNAAILTYRNSFLFLILASFIFFLLPAGWSMGFPWHLSLTLLCLSMLMGFSVEYLVLRQIRTKWLSSGIIILVVLASGAISCHLNVHHWANTQLELTVNRNALMNPPAIKDKLNKDSILVVEDSLIGEEYKLGNSAYSILQISHLDYPALDKLQHWSIMKYESLYTGTLFHWAYLLPTLYEQVFAFNAENLATVPTPIIYTWLQHFDNIFCVGYDKNANWHDRTDIFKENLLKEKWKRSLTISHYKEYAAMTLNGLLLYKKNLLLPIPELCQLECDQNQECKGTTYINKIENHKLAISCEYYRAPESLNPGICDGCKSYVWGQV